MKLLKFINDPLRYPGGGIGSSHGTGFPVEWAVPTLAVRRNRSLDEISSAIPAARSIVGTLKRKL